MKYTPIIGLEVHVELNTKSKMFCSCSAEHFGIKPNTNTCPTCLGLPGALPLVNSLACEYCLRIGLALNCKLNEQAVFARKHYAYPDLAKGYQISQYELPFCENGTIQVNGRTIRIKRVHMEEDTGKLQHGEFEGKSVSFVDFNRSGVPLVEIVTEPDFRSSSEVEEYARKLQQLMRYLAVSTADMDKGSMRFEANISLSGKPVAEIIDEADLPDYKIEIKNINSFKALVGGIEYEIKSQSQSLEKAIRPAQETKGWDDSKQKTYTQREKEGAHDYRYFPDPDISPMHWMFNHQEQILCDMPELPWVKKQKFISELGLSEYDARILTDDVETAYFFEKGLQPSNKAKAKKLANWITGELARLRNIHLTPYSELKFNALKIMDLIELIDQGKISGTNAKIIFEEMFLQGGDPALIMKQFKLEQLDDNEAVENAVKKVISEQTKAVADYKSGKTTVIQFLIGMVMKELKGKGNIDKITNILEEMLH